MLVRVRVNNINFKMLLSLLGISHSILYPQTEKNACKYSRCSINICQVDLKGLINIKML